MKSLAQVLVGLQASGTAVAPEAAVAPPEPIAAARPPGSRRIERREQPAVTLDGLPPLLQRLYTSRGVQHANELALGLDGLLPSTMPPAVACLSSATSTQTVPLPRRS